MSEQADPIAALIERARPVLVAVEAAGGLPLIVGGAVRDALRGDFSGDLDIEVHGLDVEPLLAALRPLGKVNAVGRSFGVLKIRLPNGDEYDVAIPRRENRNPGGERGVLPEYDPTMTPRDAAMRRDFTWNALALTPDGTLLDFFHGVEDWHAGIIRHVSQAFGDDPLRVLRAMRFAARFNMRLAPETATFCKTLLPDAASLALERVWNEWAKWALTPHPSAGLRALAESGWLELYPQLAALRGCIQSPQHHPEGDVWTHTGHVCDAAAKIASREQVEDRRTLLFAALCHDFGKPLVTQIRDGLVTSRGHAEAGIEPADRFLQQIGAPEALVGAVMPLIREHMGHFKAAPSPKVLRRLAVRLVPATINQWALLVEADHSGRPPLPPRNPAAPFIELAAELQVQDGPPAALVNGRDLLAVGYTPGPALGEALRRAYQAQLDGEFDTTSAGIRWLADSITFPTE